MFNMNSHNIVKSLKRVALISAVLYTYRKDVGCLAIADDVYGVCTIHNDPHFRPFHSYDQYEHSEWYFDFMGQCDLIALKSNYVNVHIRTAITGKGWSGLGNVAISFNNDGSVLEFVRGEDGNMKIYSNKEDISDVDLNAYNFKNQPAGNDLNLPTDIAFNQNENTVRVFFGDQELPTSQEITIEKSKFFPWINLHIKAHGSLLNDAVGLCGTWSEPGYEMFSGMVSRSGVPGWGEYQREYGIEWYVKTNLGDPELFREAFPGSCTANIYRQLSRNLGIAEDACGYLAADEPSLYDSCLFDVSTTGDVLWAEDPSYTDPFPYRPPPPLHESVAHSFPAFPSCSFPT